MRGRVVMRAFLAAICLSAIAAAPAPVPNYHVVARLAAGDGGWDILSVDPADQRLYIGRPDGVTAIDLRTGKATDRIVPGQRVHSALVIPGTHEVVSTNGESNSALLFDGRTGRVRATIPTGKKPDAAAWDPATKTLWIMDPGSGEATVVDVRSAKVLATVPVGGSLEFAAADGKGRMYVNVEDRNEVAVIDTKARKVVSRFSLKGCEGPTGIAYDAAAREILSACGENAVAIVSAPDGRQIASLPIGKGADGAAFDARRNLALVPGGRDGNLTLIRLGAAPKVVGQIATALSARTIALDPTTGRAYLPSATMMPAPAGERPKPAPGSFRVLVVSP
jgi:DNA-binding beta-propeller fold protein YncE